jgi:hypothetical protein
MPISFRSLKTVPLLMLVLACLPLGGCVLAAAGAAAGYGAVEYQDGLYTTAVGATVDRTWRATLAALDQMGMSVKSKTKEATSATIRARTEDGTNVEIELARRTSGDFTRVSVRVGLFGDEGRSKAIVAKIKENL